MTLLESLHSFTADFLRLVYPYNANPKGGLHVHRQGREGDQRNSDRVPPTPTSVSPANSPSPASSPADVPGPLIGYRIWRLGMETGTPGGYPDKGRLISIGIGPYFLGAIPSPADHKPILGIAPKICSTTPPSLGCMCGYWAFKRPTYIGPPATEIVYGRVILWGKVICHENGYRAQFIYPLEVIVVKPHPLFNLSPAVYEALEECKRLYGCKVGSVGAYSELKERWKKEPP